MLKFDAQFITFYYYGSYVIYKTFQFDELVGIMNNGTTVPKTKDKLAKGIIFTISFLMFYTVLDPFIFSFHLLNYAYRVEEVHLVDGVLFPQTN